MPVKTFHARFSRISIHAPAKGVTAQLRRSWVRNSAFQSTPPARGGDSGASSFVPTARIFQSTPPARGATFIRPIKGEKDMILIHAPREGGATATPLTKASIAEFQSTPPAGGATAAVIFLVKPPRFQSTPPARGATPCLTILLNDFKFQSTPPARGATIRSCSSRSVTTISIHAPARGGDP